MQEAQLRQPPRETSTLESRFRAAAVSTGAAGRKHSRIEGRRDEHAAAHAPLGA